MVCQLSGIVPGFECDFYMKMVVFMWTRNGPDLKMAIFMQIDLRSDLEWLVSLF
jgi:hypothetical protein